MRDKVVPVELPIARIGARQHGNITIRQLLAAGLTRDGVMRRVRKGLLHRVFRGVYRVGHTAPSVTSDYMAAVLACGNGAALSDSAAIHLYDLRKGRPPLPEATAPGNHRIAGVVTHRRTLAAADRTLRQNIPIVTVPRALVEIAGALDADALGEVCHEAGVRYRVRKAHVDAALRRWSNAPGSGALRDIYAGRRPILLGRMERRFRRLLRAEDLALPETNAFVDRHYVDCRWRRHGLTVELDSYAFHNSRHSWEDSYRREREARARGEEFRRFNWHDVFEESEPMLADLRRLLLRVGG